MHIAHMCLDYRNATPGNGITQGHAGVGVASGVEDDVIGPRLGFLNVYDKMAFDVGLMIAQRCASFASVGPKIGHNVIERTGPVDLGFAGAEHVEVGAVQ